MSPCNCMDLGLPGSMLHAWG
uniref:Uncharacterized protein n=1 Tax=Arundo donax TaxID=35708 RepID=A0A0A9BVG1_ARUDO